MKAYVVGTKDEFERTVVFAETAGKARNLARYTDACEDADFCDIEVHRSPKLDKYYKKGKVEMEWDNSEDRIALVKEANFRCEFAELDLCEGCAAREFCGTYEEYMIESTEEV